MIAAAALLLALAAAPARSAEEEVPPGKTVEQESARRVLPERMLADALEWYRGRAPSLSPAQRRLALGRMTAEYRAAGLDVSALETLLREAGGDPDKRAEPLEPGARLFLTGEVGRAAEFWGELRKLDGGPRPAALAADAYGLLGRRALAFGEPALAEASFSSAAALAPKSFEWARLRDLAALARGGEYPLPRHEGDESLERGLLLRRLLLAAPPAPAANPPPKGGRDDALARVAARRPPPKIRPKGDVKKAVDEGLRQYYAGDLEEARATLAQALAREPGNAAARRALATVDAAIKRETADLRYEAALRRYYAGDAEGFSAGVREALKADPSHAKAREALERLGTRR